MDCAIKHIFIRLRQFNLLNLSFLNEKVLKYKLGIILLHIASERKPNQKLNSGG